MLGEFKANRFHHPERLQIRLNAIAVLKERLHRPALVIPLLFICITLIALQQTSARVPSLETVAPPLGQVGTQFEVMLVGSAITDFDKLVFYREGIDVVGHQVVSDNELKVKLSASKNAGSGAYPFRMVTKGGISEVRTLTLSIFPVIRETPRRLESGKPMPMNVGANQTIAGTLEDGDADRYSIEFIEGERISAEVQAVRLGGGLIDTVLTVFDPSGKQIASVDDTALFHQDPFVTLVAPSSGLYTIEVHEATYQGDDKSWYALHVGGFPRPSFALPAGLSAGQPNPVRIDGDAMGPLEETIELPVESLEGRDSMTTELFAVENKLKSPTPLPIRLSRFPNSLEHEPNDAQSDVLGGASEIPIAFNGTLERDGDCDFFKFEAVAGRNLRFEVFADRLGSPIDTRIAIVDANGSELVMSDDSGTHDSLLEFRPPTSGVYWLRVTDRLANGSWDAVYRVEATVVRPELTVFLPRPDRRSQEKQTILVPRGNRSLARIGVQRKHHEADAFCRFHELPEGLTSAPQTVPADRFWMPTVLEADAKAPLGATLARVEGSSQADGETVLGGFRQVVDLVGGPADAIYHATTLDRVAVAVVEDVPFSVELVEPKVSLAIDGTLDVEILVHRTDGFSSALDVSFPMLPPMVDGPAKITIPGNQDRATYTLRAHRSAVPRTWPLVCEARVGTASPSSEMLEPGTDRVIRRPSSTNNYDGITVCSQLAKLEIGASPIQGTIGVIASEQGRTIEAICKLDCLGELPKTMQARLEGLPNRVHAAAVEVDPRGGSVIFRVELEQTAPIGKFDSIVCKLTGKLNGSDVTYFVGRGGTLCCVAQGGLLQDQSGRMLSPLEILRKQQSKRP